MGKIIKAVRVRLAQGEVGYCRQTLDFADHPVFPTRKKDAEVGAYLVSAGVLAFLSDYSALVSFIGNKNPHKGLSFYFLKNRVPKLPLLNGSYSSIGKLHAAVWRYLKNRQQSDGPGMVMLALPEELFDEIWSIADPGVEQIAREEVVDVAGQSKTADQPNEASSLLGRLTERIHEPPSLQHKYIGYADSVQLVRKQIVVAAQCDIPVLVLGDTGTGKEIVAREIHNLSDRRQLPFKAINCGAISKELLEAELFGCEKDVVGPGYPARTGLWEAAGRGTLFLDEIGDLSLDHQVKILRALQEQLIRRVGGIQEKVVQARIIAASNKDLFTLADSGRFRFDLFYRLNGIPIRTPRLRDHIEDVTVLAQTLWQHIAQADDAALSAEVIEFLMGYQWPGNVRELKMALSGLYALYHENRPSVQDMQDAFLLQGLCLHHHRQAPISKNPLHEHRVKCLEHLKKAYAVFHGLHNHLAGMPQERLNDRLQESANSYPPSIPYLVHELIVLCGDDGYYFYNAALAEKCRELCEKMVLLDDRNQPFLPEETLARDVQNLMIGVSDTIEQLLRS